MQEPPCWRNVDDNGHVTELANPISWKRDSFELVYILKIRFQECGCRCWEWKDGVPQWCPATPFSIRDAVHSHSMDSWELAHHFWAANLRSECYITITNCQRMIIIRDSKKAGFCVKFPWQKTGEMAFVFLTGPRKLATKRKFASFEHFGDSPGQSRAEMLPEFATSGRVKASLAELVLVFVHRHRNLHRDYLTTSHFTKYSQNQIA